MSRSTEYHKHIRRRLEPLRLAARPPATSHGLRIAVTAVDAFGVQHRGGTLFDAGMDWSCVRKKAYLANRFVEECVRLNQLRHPNVVMLYGIVIDGPSITLATELPAASLDECLSRYEAIPEFIETSILLDASCGLLYLHKQKPPIAHTRVSTKSVYLSSPGMRAKIGDVGVAGALAEDVARDVDSRMPPQTFIKILETGTKCTDVQMDISAFGNVIVHTVCHKQWFDRPGHTAVTSHMHAMPYQHPLYSLAYHCLLGGVQLNAQKQVPRIDIDYVVQCLQHVAKNHPPPFRTTLELYHTLAAVERNAHSDSSFPGQEQQNGHNSVPSASHNELSRLSNQPSTTPTFHPSSDSTDASTEINGGPQQFSSRSDVNNISRHSVSPPTDTESQHSSSSRHNSTGQVRAPPPKPPQRSSSFRRKPSKQVVSVNSLQRAGSLRIQKAAPLPTKQQQQQTSPITKSAGVFAGGGTKQNNSLLLPSKFSPRGDDWKQPLEQNTDPQAHHTSVSSQPAPVVQPTKHQSPDVSGSLEFERLLARRREKVEAEQANPPQETSLQLPPHSTNGTIIHRSSSLEYGTRAATDMDLPKKIAPKPPRRTSSFRSSQKYDSYNSSSSNPSVVLRQRTTDPSKLAICLSSSLTSPSTGQARPSSVGY